VCGVTVGDISLKENRVLIRGGKGDKDRYVYFGAKTARLLIRLMRGMEDKQYLWANRHNGKRMHYRGLGKTLRLLGERVGVPCTAHKFRRTFAINSLRNGMNIYTLARLMGHSDISILKPYLDLLQTDLRASHQQHGVVDNLSSETGRRP
jgi:integrase/recombinase XerD